MVEGMLAELIGIKGHNGDVVESYYARPLGVGPTPGIIVLHHGPGFDEWSKEVVRKIAYNGFVAIGPHLYSRYGPGQWDDVSALAHSKGEPQSTPDMQIVGDAEGVAAFLRAQPDSNGKVGAIGFCSGGRLAYVLSCRLPTLDAAVDCWGGNVILKPGVANPQPVQAIDMTPDMSCPLLGLFGNDDANPDKEQVNRIEEELQRFDKEYEFHRFDGAGHGFFAVDRPTYRPLQAVEGWKLVFAFFEKHLGAGA